MPAIAQHAVVLVAVTLAVAYLVRSLRATLWPRREPGCGCGSAKGCARPAPEG